MTIRLQNRQEKGDHQGIRQGQPGKRKEETVIRQSIFESNNCQCWMPDSRRTDNYVDVQVSKGSTGTTAAQNGAARLPSVQRTLCDVCMKVDWLDLV
jgi:hypothetical protein